MPKLSAPNGAARSPSPTAITRFPRQPTTLAQSPSRFIYSPRALRKGAKQEEGLRSGPTSRLPSSFLDASHAIYETENACLGRNAIVQLSIPLYLLSDRVCRAGTLGSWFCFSRHARSLVCVIDSRCGKNKDATD